MLPRILSPWPLHIWVQCLLYTKVHPLPLCLYYRTKCSSEPEVTHKGTVLPKDTGSTLARHSRTLTRTRDSQVQQSNILLLTVAFYSLLWSRCFSPSGAPRASIKPSNSSLMECPTRNADLKQTHTNCTLARQQQIEKSWHLSLMQQAKLARCCHSLPHLLPWHKKLFTRLKVPPLSCTSRAELRPQEEQERGS